MILKIHSFRVVFYDVILALIYIASDAYLIYFYLSQVIVIIVITIVSVTIIIIFITIIKIIITIINIISIIIIKSIIKIIKIIIDDQGDVWWGSATIAAVCLPGLLGDNQHDHHHHHHCHHLHH